jgi:hypothetical protein
MWGERALLLEIMGVGWGWMEINLGWGAEGGGHGRSVQEEQARRRWIATEGSGDRGGGGQVGARLGLVVPPVVQCMQSAVYGCRRVEHPRGGG